MAAVGGADRIDVRLATLQLEPRVDAFGLVTAATRRSVGSNAARQCERRDKAVSETCDDERRSDHKEAAPVAHRVSGCNFAASFLTKRAATGEETGVLNARVRTKRDRFLSSDNSRGRHRPNWPRGNSHSRRLLFAELNETRRTLFVARLPLQTTATGPGFGFGFAASAHLARRLLMPTNNFG